MGTRFYEYLLTMNQLFSEVYFWLKGDTIPPFLPDDKGEGQTDWDMCPKFYSWKTRERTFPARFTCTVKQLLFLICAAMARCFNHFGLQDVRHKMMLTAEWALKKLWVVAACGWNDKMNGRLQPHARACAPWWHWLLWLSYWTYLEDCFLLPNKMQMGIQPRSLGWRATKRHWKQKHDPGDTH